MNHPEFLQIMAYLEAGSGTGKPITETQAEVYWDFLKDLPADQVKIAAKRALAESQYPTIPPVGVLLRLAGAGPREIDTDSRALVAYTAAARAVQSAGGYGSVDFSDPIVNAAIRGMGGWQRFCDWPVDEIQWRKRDFERQYQAYMQTGVSAELTSPLAGICEVSNNGAGLEQFIPGPHRIEVELPAHRQGLVMGEPRKRIVNQEVRQFVEQAAGRLRIAHEPIPETGPRVELSEDEIAARKAKFREQLEHRAKELA